MACLYCVAAYQRGRFWFCNRCGALMLLRPSAALGVSPAQPPPDRGAGQGCGPMASGAEAMVGAQLSSTR